MNVSVVLPTYNPSERLLSVTKGLISAGFTDIIIIDDGSREDCQPIFSALSELPECTVLHHGENKGKGRGLKTGFEYVIENRPDCDGVITTDDDGQHLPEDILRCAQIMAEEKTAVFGARDFKGEHVPKKNKMGNKITGFVFRRLCGVKITDTQTGLRAIPFSYLEPLTKMNGERFEYETNMLLGMKEKNLPFREERISTVYLDGNATSHFNPLTDSFKIYVVIIKFLLSSLSCSVIDIGIFTIINMCLVSVSEISEDIRVLIATIGARIISSLVNFTLNRKRVFKSSEKMPNAMLKYYILCAGQLICSYFCVLGLSYFFSAEQSLWQSLIKIVVDTLLFFLSFGIQREWVFKKDK